jgi:alpha-L-rhamnosidase
VEIPANTLATVFIPAADADAVKESGEALSSKNILQIVKSEDGYVVVTIGSGTYHFTVSKK